MVVELHNGRALQRAAFAVCALLAVFPWMLTIPLWLKIAGSIAALPGLASCVKNPERQIRALYLESGGALSVAISSREGIRSDHKVRSIRVLRFLRHYIEMLLELNDDKTLRVMILPGICTAGAMRHLRKFLLRTYPKEA